MRKLILILVCVASCVCSFARNPVRVTGGSLDIFMEPVSVNVEINESEALIAGLSQSFIDYLVERSEGADERFYDDLNRAHDSFISYYNEKKGDIASTVVMSEECAYTLYVYVTKVNVGNSAPNIDNINYKAGGVHISGNMLLVDNATKEVICEMSFKRVKGVRSPVFRASAISMYSYLADGLLRNIRKSNKN